MGCQASSACEKQPGFLIQSQTCYFAGGGQWESRRESGMQLAWGCLELGMSWQLRYSETSATGPQAFRLFGSAARPSRPGLCVLPTCTGGLTLLCLLCSSPVDLHDDLLAPCLLDWGPPRRMPAAPASPASSEAGGGDPAGGVALAGARGPCSHPSIHTHLPFARWHSPCLGWAVVTGGTQHQPSNRLQVPIATGRGPGLGQRRQDRCANRHHNKLAPTCCTGCSLVQT